MDDLSPDMDDRTTQGRTTQGTHEVPSHSPKSEELQAELLQVPEPAEQPQSVEPPSFDHIVALATRHIRGKRGGDLLAIILVGSGARRSLTRHSDIDLIAVIKGDEDRQELIRIADRLMDIRYRGQKTVEDELMYAPRLPPLLRKGRVLFEIEAAGTRLVEKAAQRFRQGPSPAGMNEKIRMKAQCLHWLGKAEDLAPHPAASQYLLGFFLEDVITAFFRLRGLWLTSPADTLRFISSRDTAVGDLLGRFLTAPSPAERLEVGRQLADLLFKDIPHPSRID